MHFLRTILIFILATLGFAQAPPTPASTDVAQLRFYNGKFYTWIPSQGLWIASDFNPISNNGLGGAQGVSNGATTPAACSKGDVFFNTNSKILLGCSAGSTFDVTLATASGAPAKGDPGTPGTPGLGVQAVSVQNGHLMIVTTDSVTHDAGAVVGPAGANGTPGTPGVSVTGINVNASGHLIVTKSDSTTTDAGYVVGPQGPAGSGSGGGSMLSLKGAWSSTTAYNPGDIVTLNGSSYSALLAGTNQNPSTATTYWQLLAAAGAAGPAGPAGPAGAGAANLNSKQLDLGSDTETGYPAILLHSNANIGNPWDISTTPTTDPTPNALNIYAPNFGRVEVMTASTGSNAQYNHVFDATHLLGLTGGKLATLYVGSTVGIYDNTDGKQVINVGSTDNLVAQTGFGWQINTGTSTSTIPSCDIKHRATFWYTPGAPDTLQFCQTSDGTTFAWAPVGSGSGVAPTGPYNVPSYPTANVPTTGNAGALVYANDNTSGLPYYFYNTSGNRTKLLDAGPLSGIDMSIVGQIDINPHVVPQLTQNNSFTGSNTFGGTTSLNNVTITGTCTGCNSTGFANPMTALGDLLVGGTNGAAARLGIGTTGQVLTVGAGGQPTWSAGGTSYPSITDYNPNVKITGDLQAVGTAGNLRVTSASGESDMFFSAWPVSYGALIGGKGGFYDAKSGGTPLILQNNWVQFTGGPVASEPTCNAGSRGTWYYVQGVTGTSATADSIQVCAKKGNDSYGFVTVWTAPAS